MAEALAASVQLTLESTVAEGVTRTIDSLKELDDQIVRVQDRFDRMAEAMEKIGAGGESLAKAARALKGLGENGATAATSMGEIAAAMERVGSVGAAGLTDAASAMRGMSSATRAAENVDGVAAGMGKVAEHVAALSAAAGDMERIAAVRMPGAGGSGGGAGASAGGGHSGHGMDGIVLGAVGAEIFSTGAEAFTDAASIDQMRVSMRAQGISAKDTERMLNTSRTLALANPGITIEQATHAGMDLRTVLGGTAGNPGDVSPAISALPGLITNLAIFKKLGDEHGDEAFAGIKAAELLGDLTDERTGGVSSAGLQKFLNASARVAIATHNRVLPHDYLAAVKTARVSSANLSDEYLYTVLPSLMMETGGSKLGTGEMAAWRQFAGGTMTEAKFETMKKMHLVDKSATWSHGHADDMVHHLKNYDQFNTNPAEWVWNTLKPAMASVGVTDRVAQAQYAGTFMTNTGGGLVSSLILQQAPIQKDMQSISIATTGTDAATVLNAGADAQMGIFQASFHNFLTDIGGPLVGSATRGMGLLTSAFNALGQASHDHSGATLAVESGLGIAGGAGVGALLGSFLPGIGTAIGAAIGAGVVAGGELISATPSTQHGILDSAGGAGFGMTRIIIEALEHLFEKGPAGHIKVELPSGPVKVTLPGSQHVIIDNGDALYDGFSNHVAHQLQAPPTGPAAPDPRIIGSHPGRG